MTCWKDLRDRIKCRNNPDKSGWATEGYQENEAPIISAYQREIDEQNRAREASKNNCSDSGWVQLLDSFYSATFLTIAWAFEGQFDRNQNFDQGLG